MPLQRLLATDVRGGALIGGADRKVSRRAVEVGAVQMHEERGGRGRIAIEPVHPRQDAEGVGLALHIGSLVTRGDRDVVVVLPRREYEADLVIGRRVVDECAEAAVAVLGIMQDLRDWRLDAQLAAIAVHARVVREVIRMAGDTRVVVGLTEVATADDELGLMVAFEAGPRHDVEYPIGTIALIGFITAALHFEIVDVLGIELRPQVAGDVGVRNLHSVDGPGGLMPAAHVQLVMDHVGTGNEVGDHGHAVALVGAGRALDVLAADEGGRRCGDGHRRFGRRRDGHGLQRRARTELHVGDRRGTRGHRHFLGPGRKIGLRDREDIVAQRHAHEGELAAGIAGGALSPIGRGRLQFHCSLRNRQMLRVVHDTAHAAHVRGQQLHRKKTCREQQLALQAPEYHEHRNLPERGSPHMQCG